MQRKHVATAATAIGLAGVTVAIGLVLAANAPPGPFERPPPPDPVGAFRDGGVPEHDKVIEAALAQLPGKVADPVAFTSRPKLAEAWRQLAIAIIQWPDLTSTSRALPSRSKELKARAQVVSDLLAAANLGYYLDLQIPIVEGVAHPVVHGYRIDQVELVRGGERHIRVLGVRRLDPVRVGYLGRTTEELDDPIVLLDQVDAKVDEQLMPILAGYPFPLGDYAWARSARGRRVAAIAGDAIRRELSVASGDDLTSDPAPRCRRLVAASVRHHEAQHAIDQKKMLAYPPALASYVAEPADSAFAIRTRYELSAYLSQIASDMWLPQLVLWNLSRHAFRQQESRVAESFAAVVVIEQLAKKLGITPRGTLIVRGEVERDRLAALVEPLAQVPTIELRSAAAAVWAELFGSKLVRLIDESRLR